MTRAINFKRFSTGVALALASGALYAQAGETVKIAYIDPLSGAFELELIDLVKGRQKCQIT